MSEIVLLQSAQADLLEIFSRHGEAIYRIIDNDLEAIRKMPEMAPIYHNYFRRKIVPNTPFGIFYRVEGKRMMVSCIMDLRQDPLMIERRLKRP